MGLALKLNGTITASIPGAPSNGDAITMDNGKLRLTFTYGDHSSGKWCLDLLEVYDGANWLVAGYGRDVIRMSTAGHGEKTGSGLLSIITNTASVLTLQYSPGNVSDGAGNTYTAPIQFTMRTSHDYCEELLQFSVDNSVTGTADLYGAGYISGGKKGEVLKLFQYSTGPSDSTQQFSLPMLMKENYKTGRVYAKPNASATLANNYARLYGNGGTYLRNNNVLMQIFFDPLSTQTLLETNIAGHDLVYSFGGYIDWWKTLDNKYQTAHDNTAYFLQPGIVVVNPVGGRNYQLKTWLNAKIVTDTSDNSIVKEYNAFGFDVSGKMTIQDFFKTLDTYDSVVAPTMASNYLTRFNATYGFYLGTNAGTYNSFANALALMVSLRLYRYTKTADYFNNATRIKDILINSWQQSGGINDGAFPHNYTTTGSKYSCEEGTHSANADQTHIALYPHAECSIALLEYYKVNPLVATLTALGKAADYLVRVQNSQGYWPTDMNNAGIPTTTNPLNGNNLPAAGTALAGAFLLELSMLNSTATNATAWKNAGLKALNFWATKEAQSHGAYEYGEQYQFLSSQGLRLLIEGFGRAFKLTGNQVYQERLNYYLEMAIAQIKKVDVVFNASQSNNQDIHTGSLLSTLDWNGQITSEAGCILHSLITIGLRYNTDLRKHVLFYLWGFLHHITQGLRDQATYLQATADGFAYISPGTNYAASGGLDNTRFGFHIPCTALWLLSVFYLIRNDNTDIFATCLDADNVDNATDNRTIIVYNPQTGTETANITVKNLIDATNKKITCNVAGVITGSYIISDNDIIIPISLTSDQIATITVV